RALAPVERLEVRRIGVTRERWDVAGDVAAHARVFDLDDLGAEVGEDLGAEGPGAELRDGKDSNAVERRAPLRGSGSRTGVGHVSRVACPRPAWDGSSSGQAHGACRSTPGPLADWWQ